MMKKITAFLKKHRYALIWTVCYVALMWAVLWGLFDFDMFSGAQWSRLMRAHLRGFAGFVFGILLLAAIPMYVATTMIIVRTGQPLFTIKAPKITAWVKKLFPAAQPAPAPKPTADAPAQPAPDVPPQEKMPDGLPNELRAAFRRARENPAPTPFVKTPVPDATPAAPTPQVTDEQMVPDGLPLPSDFDFAPAPAEQATEAPMFKDINFDAPAAPETSPAPAPGPVQDLAPEIPQIATASDNEESNDDLMPVLDHLRAAGRQATVSDNVVLCDDAAIAAHTDPDFWIADDQDWFANGKQKPSPIAAVLHAAQAHQAHPVLYLGAENIMDLETLRAQWNDAGIRVITDLADL